MALLGAYVWRGAAMILAGLLGIVGGCARGSLPQSEQAMVLVPGAGGGGFGYDGLRRGLHDAGIAGPRTFNWGAPLPLYMLNLQDKGIHEAAEKDLAGDIERWRRSFPRGRLVLLAHSAGCGVVLGALGRLPEGTSVDRVVLLAPSVSPGYDLSSALRHVREEMHVFYSEHDKLWLSWRTGTFGTYDNIRTPAAGHAGFQSVAVLSGDLRAKVIQHGYERAWDELGNDGDHGGWLARRFVAQVLGPVAK